MKLGKLTYRPAYSKEQHVPARAAVLKVIEDANMPTETFTDSTVSIYLPLINMGPELHESRNLAPFG